MKNKKNLIVGIGSALVDILAQEDDHFITRSGAVRGGMQLVEHERIESLFSQLSGGHKVVPGGSACNTVLGVGRLGGSARFVGKCGDDDFGELFRRSLSSHAVEPALFSSEKPTGRVLSIITPDAQRSMLTYLGASAETAPEEVESGVFNGASIVHVEGYLVFNRKLLERTLVAAKDAGAKISLDLASHNVVMENRDYVTGLVSDFVDILIANEDEAEAYTGLRDEAEALEKLAEKAAVAALKMGPRGSMIKAEGRVVVVKARGDGTALDTTGAGDLWAAGFLYGMALGLDLAKCGELGSACGHEVCQVVGAHIPDEGWKRIRSLLPELYDTETHVI
ncbi:MAG: adenosine kinase [Deltaproteobacteria bacterium]|nr:adenosine kinase [Deltaproteobacteria bacterium]